MASAVIGHVASGVARYRHYPELKVELGNKNLLVMTDAMGRNRYTFVERCINRGIAMFGQLGNPAYVISVMMGNENGDRLQASLDLLKDKLRVPRIHNDGLPE